MASPETDSARQPSRRLKVAATGILVILGVAYIAYVALYLSSRVTPAPDAVLPSQAPPQGISAVFVPQVVDAEREKVQGVIRIVVDRTTVISDVTVQVSPFLDVSRIAVPADFATIEVDASLSTEGEVRAFPFDRYVSSVQMSAKEASAGTALPMTGGVVPIDGLAGWRISAAEQAASSPELLIDTVEVERAITPRVTVMVLTSLILALGVVALALAWSVSIGLKKPSFGEATWLAATIFSVVSVRNFMPGAPQIGAYLDAVAIIPVILALFLSMIFLAVFWLIRPTDEDSG